ncbi:MAG TPA: helix-turn-helix transcriptional regulator [Acidobacteriota bacterium]|nr:helix-turn-helix transcriptional regulator [Acidobacteriota bacterium]
MMRKIGRRIRHRRRLKKLTQEDLAERSGYSTGYIGSIENARKVPSIVFIFDVAAALETSAADLLIDSKGGPDREAIKDEIRQLVDQL